VVDPNGATKYCLATHTVGSHQGGLTAEDIELPGGRNLDPPDVPTSRGPRTGTSRPGVTPPRRPYGHKSAGYNDTQPLAIVTLAVRGLLSK